MSAVTLCITYISALPDEGEEKPTGADSSKINANSTVLCFYRA